MYKCTNVPCTIMHCIAFAVLRLLSFIPRASLFVFCILYFALHLVQSSFSRARARQTFCVSGPIRPPPPPLRSPSVNHGKARVRALLLVVHTPEGFSGISFFGVKLRGKDNARDTIAFQDRGRSIATSIPNKIVSIRVCVLQYRWQVVLAAQGEGPLICAQLGRFGTAPSRAPNSCRALARPAHGSQVLIKPQPKAQPGLGKDPPADAQLSLQTTMRSANTYNAGSQRSNDAPRAQRKPPLLGPTFWLFAVFHATYDFIVAKCAFRDMFLKSDRQMQAVVRNAHCTAFVVHLVLPL